LIVAVLMIFSSEVFSQSYSEMLKTIEQNNKDLQAGKKYVESKAYEYKLENLPEGPEVTYGYFPDNSTTPGAKEIFEVSQSFQIPWYYSNRSAYSNLMIEQEELKYQSLRQDILIDAKSLLIDYIYLMKQIAVNDKRLEFAEDMYNAYMVRSEVGDINALELNKTKLHLLQVQKQHERLQSDLLAAKENLKRLNGGEQIRIDIEQYPVESLVELDSIIFTKMEIDPEILFHQKATKASEKQLKVTKNLQLPEFSLGYGTETVAEEKFKGFMVGISIPLWSSRRTVQKAKHEVGFHGLNYASVTQNKLSETKVQYDKVKSLKNSLDSYETVFGSMQNEQLLNKSLELGEISVIDFFTEMFYFYEVYDDYLSVEKEYHQALAELYKYKL